MTKNEASKLKVGDIVTIKDTLNKFKIESIENWQDKLIRFWGEEDGFGRTLLNHKEIIK